MASNPQSRTAKKAKAGPPARPIPTFDHLRAKQPVRTYYWVPMDDGTLSATHQQALQAMQRAVLYEHTRPEVYQQAKDLVEQTRQELRDGSMRIVFQGIGQFAFEELMAKHPATEAQKELFKEKGGEAPYNVDTFAPYLIAQSAIEPKMTLEQVQQLQTGVLFDEEGVELEPDDERYVAPWNQSEFAELFRSALQANTSRRVADLGF